jgi:hypothetical protein
MVNSYPYIISCLFNNVFCMYACIYIYILHVDNFRFSSCQFQCNNAHVIHPVVFFFPAGVNLLIGLHLFFFHLTSVSLIKQDIIQQHVDPTRNISSAACNHFDPGVSEDSFHSRRQNNYIRLITIFRKCIYCAIAHDC